MSTSKGKEMKAKNLYLPEDVIKFAEKQAATEHRSMSNYISMLIRQEKDRLVRHINKRVVK